MKLIILQKPFINQSATKIDENYSLHRTYMLFRTLGLRHLMVIDDHNRCVGMITRQDLVPINITERLHSKVEDVQEAVVHMNRLDSERDSDCGIMIPTILLSAPSRGDQMSSDEESDVLDTLESTLPNIKQWMGRRRSII